ncbi:TRAP transporter substrate-binding protein DctP [Granulosicoccus antarcticus]|uniref:Ectoine/5-hydroxyectoine-binding periplasmic protein UehA n=1 Tax=Granulosicoccus antarcticus IMCC3135 TaxID=1192854 RepID=A0A2Z2NKT9_9GAMM|nr:TRAP transporter substrate-binding protein DctP [Granulosicoccus antarcticus]ASJ70621.1 Ectoine/5-hydroxyectoine-binding periplasmic protein UehA [Granulosicoccus antarcticus IMCC3135]
MKHEKVIGLALAVSALCALPLTAQASDDKYKLVLTSEAGDRDSVLGKSMQAWAESIETESDGRMKVNVFYQGELGGQQELFDQLVKGNVHMMITWPQTSYDQRIGVNYLPYLVMDWEDAIESFGQDGWVRDLIEPVYQDMGLKYFGPFPEGFGGVATKGRYATGFEEAKGLKVRSQPIFPLPQTIEAMGFQAVPIDWAEVYTSIQTGVVDGDSSNVIYWDYEYFKDQLDYFVQSSHNFSSYSLLMNGETWEKMDDEDRGIIETSAQTIIDQQFAGAKKEDDKWIAAAQEAGMEYIVPTADEKAAWILWRLL